MTKSSNAIDNNHILADNNSDTNVYTVMYNKDGFDSSPYRFVPIKIPSGTTKIRISCSLFTFKTNIMYFDSTRTETYTNYGAYCVYGHASGNYDQDSWVNTTELTIPEDPTIDSYASHIYLVSSNHTSFEDYLSSITIEYLTT